MKEHAWEQRGHGCQRIVQRCALGLLKGAGREPAAWMEKGPGEGQGGREGVGVRPAARARAHETSLKAFAVQAGWKEGKGGAGGKEAREN